jgi:hypothetical protein
MSPVPLRLIPRFTPEPAKCNCKHGAHLFATAELVILRAGQVVRRLVPGPGGFKESV